MPLGTVARILAVVLSLATAAVAESPRFIDHSLIVAEDYPCTWPAGFPPFQLNPIRRIGPDSAYNIDVLQIDGNTGTQLDVPPHSVARPELNFPNSGPFGSAFLDVIEPWQFCGEACVVDVRSLLDQAPDGVSPLVRAEHVRQFEEEHRPVKFGDVVLFRSDYTDRYYRPLPDGRRFLAAALEREAPGYPDPDPDCMEYLASRGVMILGTDSPSMGPLPNLAEPTHYAGLKHGMVWTESATRLGELPPTGAFYCTLGPRHKGSHYGEVRAFSIVGGALPAQLLESARNKRVIDLSPVLSADLPVSSPGPGVGRHRHPYLKVDFLYAENLDLFHHTHIMDSHAGTHLVPPAYALPPEGAELDYSAEIRSWLTEYERDYGPLGRSSTTTEKVPIESTCGPVRVIDVRPLIGSTDPQSWPGSPEITANHLRAHEAKHGELRAGEIVIFHTGHIDRHFRPKPDDAALWADPLNGKSEGWPAPGPGAISYLAERGIRCIATDAPDLGGVDPKRALMTYWALGSREMVGVEFLHKVADIPEDAYFLFAALKIRDCHGGPGRAIVLY